MVQVSSLGKVVEKSEKLLFVGVFLDAFKLIGEVVGSEGRPAEA
jgi:hypothetical protein